MKHITSIFHVLFRLSAIVVASTAAGGVLLVILQVTGHQVPYALVGWLPRILGFDGENAYDAGYLAFFLECNGVGILTCLAWKRFG